MSDPFSVAGSAVGVVSMGLTVCQGIIKYYAAYKGQDDEMDQAVEKVSHLTDLLQLLQPRLESHRTTHSTAVARAEEYVVACSEAIRRLEKVLKKCKKETLSDGFPDKLRALGRKALFPFRRETLQDLRCAVAECQENFDTAISILQLEIQGAESLRISTIATAQEAVLYNTATALEHVEEIRRMMNILVPAFTQLSTKPQLQGNIRKKIEQNPIVHVERRIYFCCGCFPRKTSLESQYRFGPVILLHTTETTHPHYETCQNYLPSQSRQQAFGFSYRVGSNSRKWDIRATVNYNYAVGAFFVSPTVAFKANVPRDHPTFRLLDVGRPDHQFHLTPFNCDELLDSLLHMFRDGMGSPTDIDTSGRTLLMASLAMLVTVCYHSCTYKPSERWPQGAQKLIFTLHSLGTPIDESDGHGRDVFDEYVTAVLVCDDDLISPLLASFRKEIVNEPHDVHDDIEFCRESIRKQANFQRRLSPVHLIQNLQKCPELMEAANFCGIDIPPPLPANNVERNQHQDVQKPFRHDVFGHTVLHLAADCPEEMTQLLQNELMRSQVNARDNWKLLPLFYACHGVCSTTTEFLLNANSSIDLAVLQMASRQEGLMKIVLSYFADRMRRLKQLAERELPSEKLKLLDIPYDHPMDVPCALHVLRELEAASVTIPEALVIGRFPLKDAGTGLHCSLFQALRPRVTVYNLIWDAGFRPDLRENSIHDMIRTPDDVMEYADISLWAINKAIRVTDIDDHNAMAFDCNLKRLGAEQEPFHPPSDIFRRLWKIFSSDKGDDHGCACCSGGCIPALASIRSWNLNRLKFAEQFERCCKLRQWTGSIFRHLIETPDFDEHEIKERQEEEWYTRSRLEPLARELSAEYEESNLPLSEFLERCVQSRAGEVLDGEYAPSMEDKQRMRELGVILDDAGEGETGNQRMRRTKNG